MNKKVRIVLYDSDKEYVESFNEYLKEQKDTGYSVILFTDVATLDMFCKNEKVDMIVIAEYLLADNALEEGCINKDDNIIILVDDKNVSFINEVATVYRYQPVDLLISSILNICANKVIYKSSSAGYTRLRRKCIVSIFSPIGRCGKTTFSINLGVGLSCRGLKVLLINLEEFSLLSKYLKGDDGENLSDLLYYYLSGNQSFAIKSEAVIRNYKGMDYIPPVNYAQDLRKTGVDTWKKFIDLIGEVKEYDTIILDISAMIEDVFEMLEFSDIIIMPVLEDEECNYKVMNVKTYIDNSDYSINSEELCIVNMNEVKPDEGSYAVKSLMDKIVDYVRG